MEKFTSCVAQRTRFRSQQFKKVDGSGSCKQVACRSKNDLKSRERLYETDADDSSSDVDNSSSDEFSDEESDGNGSSDGDNDFEHEVEEIHGNGSKQEARESSFDEFPDEERDGNGMDHYYEEWDVKILDAIEFERDITQRRGYDAAKTSENSKHICFISSDDESCSDHIDREVENCVGVELRTLKQEDVDEDVEEIDKIDERENAIKTDIKYEFLSSSEVEEGVSSDDEFPSSSETNNDDSDDEDYVVENDRSFRGFNFTNSQVRIGVKRDKPSFDSSCRTYGKKKDGKKCDESTYHNASTNLTRKEKVDDFLIGEKQKGKNIEIIEVEDDRESCDDLNGDEHIEREEKDKPIKRRRVLTSKEDVLSTLLDSIMGNGEIFKGDVCGEEEAKKSSLSENVLPLKFRFWDEDDYPPEEEKSEFDLMVEGLFTELNYGLELDEMGSFEPPRVENEESNDEPDPQITQSTLFCKGKHDQLYLDEQIGLRCLHCKAVVLEIQYVMPELVNNARETSTKKKDSCEDESLIHDLDFEASRDNNSHGFGDIKKGTVWDLIPGTREQLYPHQLEGFEFLWKNLAGTIDLIALEKLKNLDFSGGGGCIISHAPGTGKTRLTIVFLETLLKLFPNALPVIIAPASMLLTWEEEFKKWKIGFPFFNMNNLDLSGEENNICHNKDVFRAMKMHSWTKGKSILGVSYSLYEKLAGENFSKKMGNNKRKIVHIENLKKMRRILLEKPGLVVLDEGHTPRNQRSSIWNTLKNLQTEKRIILSGTPFQNNFGELFNTLHLVRPAAANSLGNERSFVDIIQPRRRNRKKCASLNFSGEAIEKLKAAMAPFVQVHKGNILQKNLPGLRDSVVLLNPPPLQKHIIERMEEFQKNTFEFEHKVALVSVHPSLLQYCSNLSEKEKSSVNQEELEEIRLHPYEGVKTGFVVELIRLSLVMSEKVLIFSQYVHPLELIKEQVREIYNWDEGKQVLLMMGKLNQKNRQKMINDFNNPKSEAKVLLASTKCCSEGINLIGASRVVLLDVVWNPSVERQAISRAYRIGQKKVVYTYHLMTSGTSEGEKYCTQAQKDRLSELVFSSSSSTDNDKQNAAAVIIDDKILEEMVGHEKLKDMFKKIIYQPKNTNLIESFGSASLS